MKKVIYEVDEQGFIIEHYVGNFDVETETLLYYMNAQGEQVELDKSFATTAYDPSFYKPKWTGSEWVEGESDDERVERGAEQLLGSLLPSLSEIADAELEIKVISLLTELGVAT